jgi:hypothetical protein
LHAIAAVPAAALPAEQSSQVETPPSLYVPGRQFVHAVEPDEPTERFPLSHEVQEARPAASLK